MDTLVGFLFFTVPSDHSSKWYFRPQRNKETCHCLGLLSEMRIKPCALLVEQFVIIYFFATDTS